jgi:hypothetical protein
MAVASPDPLTGLRHLQDVVGVAYEVLILRGGPTYPVQTEQSLQSLLHGCRVAFRHRLAEEP